MPSQAMLAKIHIAKKEMGLDDTEYRELLFGETEKTSAKDLTDAEASKIIQAFEDLGWVSAPPSTKGAGGDYSKGDPVMKKRFSELDGRPGMATSKQLRMLEAIWMNHPGVQIKTGQALAKFIKTKFKVDSLRFIERDQVGKIKTAIESIKSN